MSHFKADIKKALIIANSGYFIDGLCELPGAKKDSEIMKTFLEQNGFEVNLVEDCDKDDYTKAIDSLLSVAKTLAKSNKKGFFFVYYSGHGAIKDGMVYGIPVQGEGSDQ